MTEGSSPETGRPDATATQPALPVIADTSALQAEGWDLGSDRMRVVEHECRQGRFALLVPEVVVLELSAHGGQEALRIVTRHEQDARTLWQLGELPAKPEPASLKAEYPGRLDQRIRELDAVVLPMPEVTHRQLVDRQLLKRKPFGAKDTGYKDALIWHTLLEVLAERGGPVAFVAADGDFRDGNDLAQDLKDDLSSGGFPPDDVRLYRTFGEFIASEVPNIRELRERFEFRIRQEPELRDQLVGYLVLTADEQGPALLEQHLVNVRLLDPSSVSFGAFEPLDQPVVAGAGVSNGHEDFDVSVRGQVPVTLYVVAESHAATPVPVVVPMIDNVEVEYTFKVKYDPAAGAILGAEIDGIKSLTTDVLARPPDPFYAPDPFSASGKYRRYHLPRRQEPQPGDD